jgi:hypothetical protein
MKEALKRFLNRVVAPFMEIFGLSRSIAISAVLLIAAVIVFAVFWFFHSAPPNQITITGGPPGSTMQNDAMKYRLIMARNGVTVNVLVSKGSLENLQRLQDSKFDVDIGFVQGGVSNELSGLSLVSLGSISYEPLVVFYRGPVIKLLSEFKGKRLAIGPVGSGTRLLALALLRANQLDGDDSITLDNLEADAAAKALLEGEVDAVFLTGDSASPQLMKRLIETAGVQLLDFTEAEAYCRRISYLNRLDLPEGSIDLAKNIPAHDVSLVAPTVELLARRNLHPALCDLLIETAQEVHGDAGLLKKKGQFPAPIEHDYPISTETSRYYKSGKSFLYRWLPFWMASLVNRIIVAFVPVVVLMIPAMRLVPTLLSLRIKLRIYRWYRALLALENELRLRPPEQRKELLVRLDHIEREVDRMKVPASYADQFYLLRGSIGFVRERIKLA